MLGERFHSQRIILGNLPRRSLKSSECNITEFPLWLLSWVSRRRRFRRLPPSSLVTVLSVGGTDVDGPEMWPLILPCATISCIVASMVFSVSSICCSASCWCILLVKDHPMKSRTTSEPANYNGNNMFHNKTLHNITKRTNLKTANICQFPF